MNLNPNKIIEEGIDYRGTKWYANEGLGISQYFLYCQVPVDSTLLNDSSDDESKFRWAQDFVEDDDNNYFIVDPSHGAMISGGIISKYGRIGNWYINSHGLYQKYVSEESYINGEFVGSSKNRFVYLGMPGIKQEDLTRVKNTYDALLAANE